MRAALGALALFEGAEPAVIERLATVARPFSLTAGEYLFREGDPGEDVSLLASGGVDAIMRLPGGRELDAQRLGAGVLIGEMAMLAARPRRFSIRAAEDSDGWSFAAADIGQLGATALPEIVRRLGRVALERLRDQYELLAELCAEDPLAAWVRAPGRARRCGPRGGGGDASPMRPPTWRPCSSSADSALTSSRRCSATCAGSRRRAAPL